MSRSSRREDREVVAGPDGATPVGPMTTSGVVKTTKGYAVATVTVDEDGSLSVKLARSQAFKQYIAAEHKRQAVAEALRA